MLAYTYPLADLFGTMLGFFLLIIWFWLLIIVFSDIFRSHDLGGGAKALWVIFVIILPFLGIFVYLIARGGKMQERAANAGGTAAEGLRRLRQGDGWDRNRLDGAAGQAGRPQAARRHHRRRVRITEGEDPGLRPDHSSQSTRFSTKGTDMDSTTKRSVLMVYFSYTHQTEKVLGGHGPGAARPRLRGDICADRNSLTLATRSGSSRSR